MTFSAPPAAHVELAPFKPRPGITDTEILDAIDTMQAAIQAFPGFLRRETVKLDDGHWLDIVLWRDRASVAAAMQAVHGSEACQAFFSLIDETGVPMSFGDILRESRGQPVTHDSA